MSDLTSVVERFADQLEVDPDVLMKRWAGRPDRIAEDIFRIQDMDTGEVRDLSAFEPQRKAIHAYFFGNAQTINTYKGRRIGYSFIFSLAFLLEGIITPNSHYGIVARKFDQAKERIEDIANLIKNAKVEIPTTKSISDEIVLWNGSSYKAFTADSDGARGMKSARAVMLDEMAFMEDQKTVKRAFGAFLALGKNRKMVQISTPNVENDVFTQTHERGTPTGLDDDGNPIGVISIKQASFYNADDIDIHTSLFDQEVHPVRPDMNLHIIEEERASDPEGFGQEYLCRPIVDKYRFFSPKSIRRAMLRGQADTYDHGLSARKRGLRVIGVDVGITHDETVAVVFDHDKDRRYMRYLEVVDDRAIGRLGVQSPDRANPGHVASYFKWLYNAIDADLLVIDSTSHGEIFARQIEESIGRGVLRFDFNDKKKVAEMMGDMNNALRNDRVTLLPHDRLKDHLESIVKEKMESSRPRFTGKDTSKDGKDDLAMACVLAAYPPGYTVQPATEPAQRAPDAVPGPGESVEPARINRDGSLAEPDVPDVVDAPTQATAFRRGFGSAKISRSPRGHSRSYQRRHTR